MTWSTQQILMAMVSLPNVECVDIDLIQHTTGISRKQIALSCTILVNRELIERVKPGCYKVLAAGVVLIKSGGEVKSGPQGETGVKCRTGTLRERAWKAIRIRKKFCLNDVIVLVAKGKEKDILSNVGKYVRALERAGYLTRLAKRNPGVMTTSNGFLRYFLVRNTGPKAPVWQQNKDCVYDPNDEKTHLFEGKEHVV